MQRRLRFQTAVVLAAIVGLAAVLPPSQRAHAAFVYLPGFPTLKQAHPLTCESSAASMATRGVLTESQIMAAIPRNPNPNLGFRGNPDGQQGTALVDYGVYARPVQRALNRYGYRADVLQYARDGQIMAYLNRGWPVVAWVTYELQPATPRLASWQGQHFILVPHEHAVLIVGYDAHTLLVNDPWTATRARYRWTDFNRSWGLFGDMALAVEPCVLPGPIAGLRLVPAPSGALTWTWRPSPRATQYHVVVTRTGKSQKAVFDGSTGGTSFTLPAPRPGFTYLLSVNAVSACGARTAAQSLAVTIRAPTPTPTPVEGTAATPSPVATVLPSVTPGSDASGTPTPFG